MENISRFGWIFMESVRAGLHSMWGPGAMLWPDMRVGKIDMVYGYGLFCSVSVTLCWICYRYRITRNRLYLATFALIAYPFISFVIYVLTVIFRVRFVLDDQILLSYFIGSRYVIFPSFYIFLMGVGVLLPMAYVLRRGVVPLAAVFSLTAFAGTTVFAMTLMQLIWPYAVVDTESVWKRSVSNVRTELNEGGTVKNMGLDLVDTEFRSDLRARKYLLEHELDCYGCVHFERN